MKEENEILYQATGDHGPSWRSVKMSLKPSLSAPDGVCRNLKIVGTVPIGTSFSQIAAGVRKFNLEKGSCLEPRTNISKLTGTIKHID
jgi:hypothetical protein